MVSFKLVISTLFSIQIILSAVIYHVSYNKAMFMAVVALSMFCTGGQVVSFSTIAGKTYGPMMGGRVGASLVLIGGAVSIILSLVQRFVVPLIGYLPMFGVLCGL